MTATFAEATEDILTFFKAAWDSTTWPADYPNAPLLVPLPPSPPTPWARVRIQHFPGSTSLSGGLGTQRFERNGVFVAQIFVTAGEGLSRANSLAKIVADAFEGMATPRHVWFRNARINDVGPDGDFYQVNFLTDFTYDEIK